MWVFYVYVPVLFSSLPCPCTPTGYVWGWQPGGAAVQCPSLGTLQQGVEQQQLQWIRDQLRVWLRERKQLQREWRQQALALLQPRGKGFSLWFRVALHYYTHSHRFPAKTTQGGCEEIHENKTKQKKRPKGPRILLLACKWRVILGKIKAFETKRKKEITLLHFPQIGDEWSTLQGSQLAWSFMQLCLHSNGLLTV